MKKCIVFMVLVLGGMFLLFTVLGQDGDYGAEQEMWIANKKFKLITLDPANTPDQEFIRLEKVYRKVINRYPNSYLINQAYLNIGRMYVYKRDYRLAREKYQEIIRNFPQNRILTSEAWIAMGQSFELEENSQEALRIYKMVINQFSETDSGLMAPLYVINFLKKLKKDEDLEEFLIQVEPHYRNLASKHKGSALEIKSLRMLTNAYLQQEKWDAAVSVLGDILLQSMASSQLTPQEANVLIRSINAISITELKNYDLPIKIYEEFIASYPNHGLSRLMKELIKALTALKSQKAEFTPKSFVP